MVAAPPPPLPPPASARVAEERRRRVRVGSAGERGEEGFIDVAPRATVSWAAAGFGWASSPPRPSQVAIRFS